MGIQDDILEAFFTKLGKDEDFSENIVRKLRRLWENKNLTHEEKILQILKDEIKDAGQNKSD